jgi:hypothetical protein
MAVAIALFGAGHEEPFNEKFSSIVVGVVACDVVFGAGGGLPVDHR